MSTTITASAVNELRQKTGAGLMDCKKALAESNGDFEAAIDYLRKKGAKVAAMRSDRDAKEGAVIALTNEAGTAGVILHLTSETDFVAKNEEFVAFATDLAKLALENNCNSSEEVLALSMGGAKVSDKITEMVGKIGERIEVKNFVRIEAACVVPYIHMNNKLAVLVNFNQPKNEKLVAVGKDIAMQIAAMNPISVDKEDVPAEVLERELEIGREQARAENKPAEMIEKIAQGKLGKFYKEQTLTGQQFVKDGSKTVADVLKEVDAALKVVSFRRVTLGS